MERDQKQFPLNNFWTSCLVETQLNPDGWSKANQVLTSLLCYKSAPAAAKPIQAGQLTKVHTLKMSFLFSARFLIEFFANCDAAKHLLIQ